jgi:parallel beta-helix repeat protein
MSKNSARAKNGMVRGIVTVALVVLMCLSVLPLMTFETGASIPIPTTISIPKTILVDTDWDSGTCTMSANVTVKSPATLRIANATIDIVNNWTSHDSGGGHNKSLMGYSPFADFGKYFGFKVENGAKLIIYNTTIRGKTKADKYNIIIDGTVDIRSSTFKNLDYDGILVDGDDGVHPVLKNNKFITVTDALTIYNTTSSILNTTFSTVDNNGIYFMNSTLTIKDDTFSGTYNAIRGEQSTCTIEKNTIGLTNTGIYLYNGDCTIKNNTINGDPKGYTGIDLESPKGSYYVNDNEIYDLYNGILSYGNSMVFINTVHDCDVGIAMYNKGGGGGNKTMAVTGINIVWNTLTTIRYQGIVVYGGNNIDVSNNTITTVGTNWDTGQGISLGLATGTVADNNISDVQGYGISLNQGANGITFSNNAISNVRAGNNGVEQTGGVSIEYADQFAQWDLYPSYFYFNKVAIPFRFNNAGTINLWAFDLTGKDLGTTMDILEIGEWISTDVYLYNTFYDDYKLEAYPYGPQVQSSITVSWSTNFHGFWESSNDPVVMGTVTVNDTYGEPAFQGNTDSNGYLGPFYLAQIYEVKTSGQFNSSTTKKVFSPYLFQLEGGAKGFTYTNETNVTITGISFIVMTLDDVTPFLKITSPTEGTLTNATSILVTGSTERLSHVTINNVKADVTPDGDFSATVPLPNEGKNTITVLSVDKGKNQATRKVNVTRDTILPELAFTYPEQDGIYNKLTLPVRGTTEAGAFLTVQGKNVTVDQDGAWNTTVTFDREGASSVTVIARDAAGNTVSITHTFTIDINPPTLFIMKPLNNTMTKNPTQDVSGSIEKDCTLTVNGRKTPYDGTTFSTTVELVEGVNTITVTATDQAGNSKTAKVVVNRDSKPPALTIISPPDNLRTSKFSITVNGTTEKNAIVTINGVVVENKDGTFSDTVFLNDGGNRITVEATDQAGNTATKVRKVFKEAGGTADPVTVTSPENGTVISSSSIVIKGSLNELGTLTLNGQKVTVDANDNFEYTVPLAEGKNVLTLTLKDLLGNNFTLTWVVVKDTTAPNIEIISPKGTVDQANVLVRGKTEANATVTVNGLMVYVSASGEFTAPATLNPGKNKIYVTAVDKVGNAKAITVDVNYQQTGAVSGLGAGSAMTLGLFVLLIILVVVIMVLMVMMMKRMGGRGGGKTGKDIEADGPDEKEMTPEKIEDDEVPEKEAVKAPTKAPIKTPTTAPSKAPTTLPPPLPPNRPVDVKFEPKVPAPKMK